MIIVGIFFEARPRRLRDMRGRCDILEGRMDERKDPMELWIGTWTPKDVIDREVQRLNPPAPDTPAHEETGEREPTPS
jgi:hypothetical protein